MAPENEVETAPVTETAAEVEVETPAAEVTETPEVVEEAPAFDWADEALQTRAQEAISHLEKWGDPTAVEQALAIQAALNTEEGITQLFVQAGRSLGLGQDKLEALFGEEVAAEETEEIDEDRVLTVKEARELFAKETAEAQRKSSSQREVEAAQATAQAAVTSTLSDLKITDPAEINAVLTLGQQFLADDDVDPEHVKAAVRKGWAEYERVVKERAKKYVTGKVENAAKLPGSIGGAAPGGDDLPEPKSVEEAKQRVRAALRNG